MTIHLILFKCAISYLIKKYEIHYFQQLNDNVFVALYAKDFIKKIDESVKKEN